jgi:SAM-dependent methyltransferase
MTESLRRAWTEIVTAEDYDQHMAAIGQAQAGADLTRHILQTAGLQEGARVVIAGAGTGQMLDYLDPALLRPYRLTFTDLSPAFLARLQERLARCGLRAEVIEDDIEKTAIEEEPGLLLATLLLEHIDWRQGVKIFAALHPAVCAIVLQENPPGMTTAVTPGRQLPPSLAKAMETAHATLVPRAELAAAFTAEGYQCQDVSEQPVADAKSLVALSFTPNF